MYVLKELSVKLSLNCTFYPFLSGGLWLDIYVFMANGSAEIFRYGLRL